MLQFEAMDQKLAAQLAKLFEARRRRAMLLGFAEAPVAMLNAAIAAAVRFGGGVWLLPSEPVDGLLCNKNGLFCIGVTYVP